MVSGPMNGKIGLTPWNLWQELEVTNNGLSWLGFIAMLVGERTEQQI